METDVYKRQTENQIVAVIISFIFNFFYILYFDTLAKAITVTPISKAMLGLSITQYLSLIHI